MPTPDILALRREELQDLRQRRDDATSLRKTAELTEWIDEPLAEIGRLRHA